MFQVAPVDVGDFQLAAGRWAQPGGNVEHGIVVKIKPSDRPIGQELGWLFDDIDGLFEFVEFHHAVLVWLVDVIGEYGGAVLVRDSVGELGAQAMAVEHVVAEDQRNAIVADEFSSQNKGMGKPDRFFLNDVVELDAPADPSPSRR